MDGDGDCDIFTCEMEHVAGDGRPRWYIQENLDGVGGAWQEHVILDAGPGGHEAVVGDVSDNGLPDIIAKPWVATPGNALGGKMFVLLLENPGPD
ncbi:MAG: VCBS repeat-containing protein [Anaerolineaceae bacterium]|nr:VCBS repeat-containing protein [Anaerolineaceae bacterium]MDE0329636.1 VCBS repeat-containing protein [Anaerolineaceae bacterium]